MATSAKAAEFLTKQLYIQKETVTFRWLSRELSVHVNLAKNELASFYASSRSSDNPVHATYLVIGAVAPIHAAGSYGDDDKDQMDVEDTTLEMVETTKIVLVGEDELEAAKAQFLRPPSVHIYSLSTSTIRDATLLALKADRVREDDVSKGRSYNQTIGIVVGSDVKIGQSSNSDDASLRKGLVSASSSKLNPPSAEKATADSVRSKKSKVLDRTSQDERKKGTLHWSMANRQGENEKSAATTEKTKEAAQEFEPNLKEDDAFAKPVPVVKTIKSKGKEEHQETRMNSKQMAASELRKRGTKRSSAVMSLSDTEDDNPPSYTKPRSSSSPCSHAPPSRAAGVKVKNGVLLSDDDGNSTGVIVNSAKQKGKARARVIDEEDGVDSGVQRMVNRDGPGLTPRNQSPVSDRQLEKQDTAMLSDSEPIPQRAKTKRKPKKLIPLGHNGQPKRRIIKSRKSKNAKGYTITEDYSSYESVSEAEDVQTPHDAPKKPRKARNIPNQDDTPLDNSETSKSKTRLNNNGTTKVGGTAGGVGKSEAKKQGSGSANNGGGPKTSTEPKARNLMSYFTKK